MRRPIRKVLHRNPRPFPPSPRASTPRSMPARTARRAFATPTGRASACCRRRAPTARRGCSSSPAAPAAGRAFSRSIAGSSSSRRTPPPGAATTWSAGASRCAAMAGRRTAAGSAIPRALLVDVRGAEAAALIPKVKATIAAYSYNNFGDYRMWPGPNSNTFTATVLRAVPELETTLPPNAVGKDFRPYPYAGLTDSRTGVEASLWGAARREARLGRRRRAQLPRAGCGARSAPSRREAAGLRPHRHRRRYRDRRARTGEVAPDARPRHAILSAALAARRDARHAVVRVCAP